jgi:hypothetical protein
MTTCHSAQAAEWRSLCLSVDEMPLLIEVIVDAAGDGSELWIGTESAPRHFSSTPL